MGLLTQVVDWASDVTGLVVVRARLPAAQDDDEVTLDVPGYRQVNSYACGFVAGLMVLHMFRPEIDIDTFYTRVGPDPDDGTPASRIIRALQHHRITVRRRYDLDFGKVVDAIDQGRPIITLTGDSSHWIVIYGFGVRPRRVFVGGNGVLFNDPVAWGSFRRQWAQGYGLVCSKRRRPTAKTRR